MKVFFPFVHKQENPVVFHRVIKVAINVKGSFVPLAVRMQENWF